jgi:hypothetical protein
MRSKKEFAIDALHIFILVSLAFAQPLYVISRYAEFFVAHNATPADIIFVLLVPCLFIPGFLVLMEYLAGLIHERIRKALRAALSGILITAAYIRAQEVRKFLTILLPVLFIFPYLFLFDSPVNKVVFPAKESSSRTKVENGIRPISINKTPPIIMVVFDEFLTTSMMNKERTIDHMRYPHFAAFAKDAIWFRNATTVGDNTGYAVPSILTGKYPEHSVLPTLSDHPNNIFTLLGSTYEITAFEPITQLCPEIICKRKDKSTLLKRLSSIISDLTTVTFHILLPADMSTDFPLVTQAWKNFSDAKLKKKSDISGKGWERRALTILRQDRLLQFQDYLNSLKVTEKPALYFLHTMLPHTPYKYLPSGKTYNYSGFTGLLKNKYEQWSSDEWAVLPDYQRYLLQVGFVDTLLGRIVEKLREIGLYEQSLIIITADHGVSYRPNDLRRPLTETNFQDIMPVPLFIKLPNQEKVAISERYVETIDILPTIADILDVQLPWKVDGESALDFNQSGRNQLVIYYQDAKKNMVIDPPKLEKAKLLTLKRKLSLFGSGERHNGLFYVGPNVELIGKRLTELKIAGEASIETQIEQTPFFNHVDHKSSFVPVHILGQILPNLETPIEIALAINETIAGVSKSFQHARKEVAMFSAIVPETTLRAGKNQIEAFVVYSNNGQLHLMRTKNPSTVSYSLVQKESIKSSNGKSFPVVPEALTGSLDFVDVKNEDFYIIGWASDVKNLEIPEAILIFVNGKFFYAGGCNTDRPDVAEAFSNETLLRSGFKYSFPVRMFEDIHNAEVRIFVVSKKGVATELPQTERSRPMSVYTINESIKGKETITSPQGMKIPIVSNALKGSLDTVTLDNQTVLISGWAADIENSKFPVSIVIFINGKFFQKIFLNTNRQDVVVKFNNEALRKSGFQYSFPITDFDGEPSEARIFAISKRGVASELKYPRGYKWGK